MFATINYAMTFVASGILGILTWLLTHSVVATYMVVGSVILFLMLLGLLHRLYYVPRRVNRMVEELHKQYLRDSRAS